MSRAKKGVASEGGVPALQREAALVMFIRLLEQNEKELNDRIRLMGQQLRLAEDADVGGSIINHHHRRYPTKTHRSYLPGAFCIW